ncbi:MAG: hypothetical protein A2X18_02750 [Bacteroidetes bacterium GWF2_40_14]|nr:MAG: hypothetical protein A2X18_02750 [Bacteroidetes bacterium GWF2_40_14]
MRRFHKLVIIIISAVILDSCQKTEVADFQDKAVVEAYLFANQTPVVKVSKLIPFSGSASFSDMDIDKLSLQITEKSTGNIFVLTSIGEGRYKNESLNVKTGDTYSVTFPYNGDIVDAATTVPEKPQKVKATPTSVTVSQPGEIGGEPGGMPGRPTNILITWENSEKSYYLIVVQNMETSPVAIYDEEEEDDRPSMSFRSEPTQADSCKINSMTFQYYGRHRVMVNKIQPEYALLYSNNSNSSQSLTEIHANVTNGFGIFTAINSDTLFVRVLKP